MQANMWQIKTIVMINSINPIKFLLKPVSSRNSSTFSNIKLNLFYFITQKIIVNTIINSKGKVTISIESIRKLKLI